MYLDTRPTKSTTKCEVYLSHHQVSFPQEHTHPKSDDQLFKWPSGIERAKWDTAYAAGFGARAVSLCTASKSVRASKILISMRARHSRYKEDIMTNITFNNLSKADGSALIDEDSTVVQASVFGPVDVSQSKINYEEAILDIIFKPKISIPSSSPAFDRVREVEDLLKCIFKEVVLTRLHPRTSITIMVQEIYDNGSMFSAAINAVCFALIDAGLPMKCPVSAVSLSIDNPDGDRQSKACTFNLVFDNKLDLITIITRGCTNEDNLKKAVSAGRESAKANFDLLRTKLKERFTD